MKTYVICKSDGEIVSVRRGEGMLNNIEVEMNAGPHGFSLDLSGQAPFEEMDILDIHNGYKADPQTKKLIPLG